MNTFKVPARARSLERFCKIRFSLPPLGGIWAILSTSLNSIQSNVARVHAGATSASEAFQLVKNHRVSMMPRCKKWMERVVITPGTVADRHGMSSHKSVASPLYPYLHVTHKVMWKQALNKTYPMISYGPCTNQKMEQSLFFWFERTSVSGEFPNACVLTEATQWIRNGK